MNSLSSAREAAALFVIAANLVFFVVAPLVFALTYTASKIISEPNTSDPGPK